MRKNFGVKSWFYPQPVLIIATYDENGKPDAMNAAWGGLYDGTLKESKVLEGDALWLRYVPQKKWHSPLRANRQRALSGFQS